jgi:N-acetyl-anhydromuramyl-L-alanine amidase AmpD
MTLGGGLLAISDGKVSSSGFIAASPGWVSETPVAADPISNTRVPVTHGQWTGILIHHSDQPAGDAQSLHRRHLEYGLSGLGYHFVIGNGNGMGDGVIHVGYRWTDQLAGAHAARGADQHNLHSIGICLIGNGDRRPFSDRQMRQLVNLVQRLQREHGIPASAVKLHREVAPGITSPGRFFAAGPLREQLLP